jgi:hypothetical protein
LRSTKLKKYMKIPATPPSIFQINFKAKKIAANVTSDTMNDTIFMFLWDSRTKAYLFPQKNNYKIIFNQIWTLYSPHQLVCALGKHFFCIRRKFLEKLLLKKSYTSAVLTVFCVFNSILRMKIVRTMKDLALLSQKIDVENLV